ncbi:Thioredoxin-like protein AAED1, chloroplastic [Vitis vinifera]|uniref:Thioredoxin-like protein AAED1, chloroplastic n=1 Tax=Vitis vinifera TaxID=29760 RepID=A0A438DW13_VITVI|nr:Thioredoxin-like protein AAED1, chloroplastic [Vitis vinifera]
MAISLSTTILPNTIQRRRITILPSPRVSRNLGFSLSFRPCNESIELSSSRRVITASAASGSPGKAQVFDLNGNGIPISDLWKDRKAVVAFARHFGCVFCRKRADLLASQKDRMDASGVALVLIGPGSIDQAKAFSEQTNFKGGMILKKLDKSLMDLHEANFKWQHNLLLVSEVYADPSHSSYEVLGFVSGVLSTFTPQVLKKCCRFKDYTIVHGRLSTGLGAFLSKGYRDKRRLLRDFSPSISTRIDRKEASSKSFWISSPHQYHALRMQQGGIIVAGPGKSNISYIHKDKEAGDDPDMEDILTACCS